MSTLFAIVDDFLIRRLQAERIDRLPWRPGVEKADFLLGDRGIVLELKTVTDDRQVAAQRALDQFRRDPDWPVFQGEKSLSEVLAMHPRHQEVTSRISRAITCAIEDQFEKGNRQIRDTKAELGIPDAQGVLLFLNDATDVLDPKALGTTLSRLVRKRRQDKLLRHESVDGVIGISSVHRIPDGIGGDNLPVFWSSSEELTPEEMRESFEAWFIEEFASFLKKPMRDGGVVAHAADFEHLPVLTKLPPIVLDGIKLPGPELDGG